MHFLVLNTNYGPETKQFRNKPSFQNAGVRQDDSVLRDVVLVSHSVVPFFHTSPAHPSDHTLLAVRFNQRTFNDIPGDN